MALVYLQDPIRVSFRAEVWTENNAEGHTDTHRHSLFFFFLLMDTDTLLCTDFNRSGLLNCILYEYIIHSSLFVIIFIGPHPNPFYWPPPPISNGSLTLLTYFVPFPRAFPSNKLVDGES